MVALSTCTKCGALVRDDGSVVGGEDNCRRRVPPENHSFVPLQAMAQHGMRLNVFKRFILI